MPMPNAQLFQRFLILCLFAFWFGGLTFYAVIVIPTGAKVLGSDSEQGFITQQVTHWLNIVGVFGTIILAWNVKSLRHSGVQIPRKSLTLSCVIIAVSQTALFLIHPVMDRVLDTTVHGVNEPITFYQWHRAYLLSVTGLWLGGIFHLWFLLKSWHAQRL